MLFRKCQKCSGKTEFIRTEITVNLSAGPRRVINMPARRCRQCGRVEPSCYTLEQLEHYARVYKTDPLDCIAIENEEATVINMMFM